MLKPQAYTSDGQSAFFDEMLGLDGTPRQAYAELVKWLGSQSRASFRHKQQEADAIFRRLGITFAVYGDKVYLTTLDSSLVALDSKTGEVKWSKPIADRTKAAMRSSWSLPRSW